VPTSGDAGRAFSLLALQDLAVRLAGTGDSEPIQRLLARPAEALLARMRLGPGRVLRAVLMVARRRRREVPPALLLAGALWLLEEREDLDDTIGLVTFAYGPPLLIGRAASLDSHAGGVV